MPFLNSLVDPYGVLARGTYGEDNDEDWRNRRPTQRVSAAAASPPATPPGDDGGRGGGGGRGDFLASLAQMGPLIAQIFQSTATGDSIQRALSDHAATMERYNESRRLQAERAKERSFAAEQSNLDRTARKEERAEDAALQRELVNTRERGDSERQRQRIEAEGASRTASIEAKNLERFESALAEAVSQVGAAAAFDPQTKARQAEFIEYAKANNGQLPAEAYEGIQRAQFIKEKRLIAERKATSEGRQPTPQELILAGVDARLEYAAAMYKDRDPTLDRRTEQEHYDSVFGPGAFQRDWNLKTQGATFPPPQEPVGVEVARTLSNPESPDFPEMKARVERMGVNEFRNQVGSLLEGATPEAQREILVRIAAYASPEVQREITRMLGGTGDGTTTRAARLVQETLGDVGTVLGASRPGQAASSVANTFRSGWNFLTERVPE